MEGYFSLMPTVTTTGYVSTSVSAKYVNGKETLFTLSEHATKYTNSTVY